MRESDKKWLADKSIELDEINKTMVDLIRKNADLYKEIIKIQDEFLEKTKNILEEKK
tara:strand:- start:1147 stop:1317 length:171 start_codon:yes stop_codon:yes gene_type:complete